MRITFVLEYYEPHIGGVEVVFKRLAEALVKLGWKVNVVTLMLPDTKSEETINGVKVYRVKVPIFYPRYWFSIFAIPQTFELISKSDIVHTTTYTGSLPAFLISKLLRKPCIITVHEFFGDRWKILLGLSSLLAKTLKLLEKIIISLPFNKFVTVSESTKKYLENNNVKDIKVIYNGVDYKLFNPKKTKREKFRKRLGLKNDFVYMFWGRPGITKGVEYFVNAIPKVIEKIPKSKFLIILGDDPPYRRRLILDLIKNLKLENELILLDSVPRKDLPNYIAAADCIILPSLSEGFGLNVAEACAMNKPVISSDIDSIPEVVSGKYILVKPKDSSAIADACVKIYKKKYNKSKKKIFKWDDCIKGYLEVYKSILNK